ncbi:uncharacterized protein BKCO1_3100072 [Diplodia corticola]|uniref:Uncharacterized protein n=1 Tax=Diplodia corticola TaxID=236234 RepID=A0A1J9QWK7_9PEZI|nr:uncharacterized protein BKCO1_3100072 [Diplodia corticola]OJD33374.1 hypothetical protein BKCO1_3100072 [Diplodia corticola]
MPDFIKFAMYGAIKPPADYNPDNYYVDKEDKKSKRNKKSKDANGNDDRSSVRSFEGSDETVVDKDGKTTTRHGGRETKDTLQAPEGSSRSKSRSRSRRRVKVHDAGPGGAKGVFNSVFGQHGYANGWASLKW